MTKKFTKEEGEIFRWMSGQPVMVKRCSFLLMEPTTALFFECLSEMSERWTFGEHNKREHTAGKRHEYKPPWVHDPRKEGFFPCSRNDLMGIEVPFDWGKLFDEEEANRGVASPAPWTVAQQQNYLTKLKNVGYIEIRKFGVPPARWIRINWLVYVRDLAKKLKETKNGRGR